MRALQGHNQAAMRMIQVERLLEPADVEGTPDIMLHRAYRKDRNLIAVIRDGGLKAGGRSDPTDPRTRAHIHLVASIQNTGDLAGVRNRTDTCLEVRIKAWLEHSSDN